MSEEHMHGWTSQVHLSNNERLRLIGIICPHCQEKILTPKIICPGCNQRIDLKISIKDEEKPEVTPELIQ